MPFNYISFTNYRINYEKLYSEIMDSSKNHLFSSYKYRDQYTKEWINLLLQAEQKSDLIMQNEEFRKRSIAYFNNSEIFQFPVHYKSQTIYIHFFISGILENFPLEYEKNAQFIDVSEFSKPQTPFLWTPAKSFISNKQKSNIPIIAVPYLNSHSTHLIIDGNTRLTSWIQNKSSIPTIFIEFYSLVNEQKTFCSAWDRLHYIFRYDIMNLSNLSTQGNLSDQILLEHSLLNGFSK